MKLSPHFTLAEYTASKIDAGNSQIMGVLLDRRD